MAATRTPAPVMVQTNTYDMNPNENHQCRSCLLRFCSIFLTIVSCITILMGASVIAIGASTGKSLSIDSSYEISPELKRSKQTTRYTGIGVLMFGNVLMILCIILCRHIKRSNANPAMYSGTGMTTTIVAPPNASSSGVVQPPRIQGTGGQPTYTYLYQPAHPGSSQHVQPASNQYPPVPSASNQYCRVQARQSAPFEESPDQPPPSYNELMHPGEKITIV